MISGQAAMATADGTPTQGSGILGGRLIGLAIIAIAPTIFWTATLYLAASASGRPLTLWPTVIIAAAMFAFLTCIWACFAMSDQRPPSAE